MILKKNKTAIGYFHGNAFYGKSIISKNYQVSFYLPFIGNIKLHDSKYKPSLFERKLYLISTLSIILSPIIYTLILVFAILYILFHSLWESYYECDYIIGKVAHIVFFVLCLFGIINLPKIIIFLMSIFI